MFCNVLSMRGNTVLVIEHNLDVIKTADRLIDLGPEKEARAVVPLATGTPEQVEVPEKSHGSLLARYFLNV